MTMWWLGRGRVLCGVDFGFGGGGGEGGRGLSFFLECLARLIFVGGELFVMVRGGSSFLLTKQGREVPEVAMEEEMICRLQVLDTILLLRVNCVDTLRA